MAQAARGVVLAAILAAAVVQPTTADIVVDDFDHFDRQLYEPSLPPWDAVEGRWAQSAEASLAVSWAAVVAMLVRLIAGLKPPTPAAAEEGVPPGDRAEPEGTEPEPEGTGGGEAAAEAAGAEAGTRFTSEAQLRKAAQVRVERDPAKEQFGRIPVGAADRGAEPAPLNVYQAERRLAVAREGDLQYDAGDIIVRVGDAPRRNTDREQWSLGYKAKDPSREVKLFRTGVDCCVEKLVRSDVAWLTESTVDGLTAVDPAATDVTGTPTAMMLCNDDGSEKHTRWFWIDAKTCALHWAKKRSGSGKQQQLTGRTQRACERRLTFETSEGEVSAIAESSAVARAWAQAVGAMLKVTSGGDLDAYTVVRAPRPAEFREGEDLQLKVGDTIVRVGPAPNWTVGYVLGREPREAKPFPTGPIGYLHQIGPEDLCELMALQLEDLCGSGVDAAELTVVQPDQVSAGLRDSVSGAQLLQPTQSVSREPSTAVTPLTTTLRRPSVEHARQEAERERQALQLEAERAEALYRQQQAEREAHRAAAHSTSLCRVRLAGERGQQQFRLVWDDGTQVCPAETRARVLQHALGSAQHAHQMNTADVAAKLPGESSEDVPAARPADGGPGPPLPLAPPPANFKKLTPRPAPATWADLLQILCNPALPVRAPEMKVRIAVKCQLCFKMQR